MFVLALTEQTIALVLIQTSLQQNNPLGSQAIRSEDFSGIQDQQNVPLDGDALK